MTLLGYSFFQNALDGIVHKRFLIALLVGLLYLPRPGLAETIRIATLNLDNYLSIDRRVEGRWRPNYPKPEVEKAALRTLILKTAPQVLAVQEIGSWAHLRELQRDLVTEGITYPHLALIEAADPDRHIAVLSQITFSQIIEVDYLAFPYFSNHQPVQRGLLEVVFSTQGIRWSLFNLHLKSRYTNRRDDPQSRRRREGEAATIAQHINQKYPLHTQPHFLIVGDFNDTPADRTPRLLTQEQGQRVAAHIPCFDIYGEPWTYYYAKKDAYYCFDGVLVSPALLSHVKQGRGVVVDARRGSDHRLVYIDLLF